MTLYLHITIPDNDVEQSFIQCFALTVCVACLSDQLITLSQGPKQLTLALRSWW